MYQEVLDALNKDKTTQQHVNALTKLFVSATDPVLKRLLSAVVSEYLQWLNNFKKLSSRKTHSPNSQKINVARAQLMRSIKFTPSMPMQDGTVPRSVSALIAYCNSMV